MALTQHRYARCYICGVKDHKSQMEYIPDAGWVCEKGPDNPRHRAPAGSNAIRP